MGTAAGGGLPQWNCNCPNCRAVRQGAIPARLQASAAFSPDGLSWYVVNATPDLTTQLARWPELHPSRGVRHTPIAGVLLTDGEFDHVLGLLHLREGAGWILHATAPVLAMLEHRFAVLPALQRYVAGARVSLLALDTPLVLGEGKVAVYLLETGRDQPRYTGSGDRVEGAVVALVFEVVETGRRLAYAPGVSQLSQRLFEGLSGAEVVLFDGTLWSEDELARLGISQTTAADMGHVPMSGPEGSAVWLSELPAKTKRYVHINNTNPVLDPESKERRQLRALGLDIAEDGWEISL